MIRGRGGDSKCAMMPQNIKASSVASVPDKSKKVIQETTLQLRKQRRDARLKTRRMVNTADTAEATIGIHSKKSVQLEINECLGVAKQWQQSPPEYLEQFIDAVKKIRRMLCQGQGAPVKELIEAGLLPILCKALQYSDEYPELQFEAAWVLTNLASTNRTKDVAECDGVVMALASLLTKGRTALLREQCAWCIGNIAGESEEYRLDLIKIGVLKDGLVNNLLRPETQSLMEEMVWATSNLLRSSSSYPVKWTLAYVRPLIQILSESALEQEQLRCDVCYALGYLAEGDPENGERAQVVLQYNALEVLINALSQELQLVNRRAKVLTPLVRCLGMIAVGTSAQLDALCQAGFLQYLPALMRVQNRSVLKEVAWCCSNIAAGTVEQADAFVTFGRGMLLAELSEAAQNNHWEVRVEALYALCNLLSNDIPKHTRAIIDSGGFVALCANLTINDVSLLLNILDGIVTMFRSDLTLKEPCLALVMEEEGGIDKLEMLLDHQNDSIYKKSLYIIEEFIGTAEPDLDEGDQNMCPGIDGDKFGFGLSAKRLGSQFENLAFDLGNLR